MLLVVEAAAATFYSVPFIQVFSLIFQRDLKEVGVTTLFIDEATMTHRGKNLPMVTRLAGGRAGLKPKWSVLITLSTIPGCLLVSAQ